MQLKRTTALEALVIGLIGLGGVVAARALYGSTRRRIDKINEKHDPHQYAVMYSAHGGDFHYLNGSKEPTPPHHTRSEARKLASRFAITGKSIGGKAKVVNVNTGEEVPL
ncbi:MAG TPA: hypothetical protein V6C81_18365 [Planktothrix sp.]